MSALTQKETMLRKPILMPPSMIRKVDRIARKKKVSFAEVVREAVDAFGGQPAREDELILEALAETMIDTTSQLIARIEDLERRLDQTHHRLESV